MPHLIVDDRDVEVLSDPADGAIEGSHREQFDSAWSPIVPHPLPPAAPGHLSLVTASVAPWWGDAMLIVSDLDTKGTPDPADDTTTPAGVIRHHPPSSWRPLEPSLLGGPQPSAVAAGGGMWNRYSFFAVTPGAEGVTVTDRLYTGGLTTGFVLSEPVTVADGVVRLVSAPSARATRRRPGSGPSTESRCCRSPTRSRGASSSPILLPAEDPRRSNSPLSRRRRHLPWRRPARRPRRLGPLRRSPAAR